MAPMDEPSQPPGAEPEPVRSTTRARLASGVPGLDVVLGGGLIRGGIYLLAGGPGTGKTVLANQYCFTRARAGDPCLYLTMLAEPHSRMIGNLETFEFFDPAVVNERITYLSGTSTLRDGGLQALFSLAEEQVLRRGARLLVLDGFRIGVQASRDSDPEQTLFFNRLAGLLEFSCCTAIVCTLSTPRWVCAEHALADGLIELDLRETRSRAVRELFVVKHRGSLTLEGNHVLEIDARGMVVYPRIEALLAHDPYVVAGSQGRERFGIESLDAILAGGLPATSSTAILGATGSGKTLLGLHFLREGARLGERGLYFGFYESPERVLQQGEGVGLPLRQASRDDLLDIVWQRPFENLLDRIAQELLEHVEARGIRRLFIDGMDGLRRGVVFPERAPTVLAAVGNRLRALGVTLMFSVETQLLGTELLPEEPWSALVENTIVLRYVELRSHLHRLIWIVKLRGSGFDSSLREFTISSRGIEVADTFESAEAMLSGLARREAGAREGEPRAGG